MSVTELLRQTEHRPWPLPGRAWVMHMRWRDLLFLHWPVEAAALRPHVPEALGLDEFKGRAWLGVIPFRMEQVGLRGLRPLWGWYRFLELNLRTYVTVDGKPGVYFFSLDANSPLAVRLARWGWGLAYFDARMRAETAGDGWVDYRSERTHRGAPPARFAGRYRGTGEAYQPAAGSLEQFVMERYALYVTDRQGRPRRGDIHHLPWRVRRAEVELGELDMTRLLGMALPAVAPVAHVAEPMEVVAWGVG